MKSTWMRSLLLASSALAVSGAVPPALAAADPAPQPGNGTIEEIVVTAQRHAEGVLSVPMSIQAATGEQLNNLGIKSLSDLKFSTPGYVPTTSSGYAELYIRGIGNNIFIGADPSVATFIDDVPRIWGSLVDNFEDAERVEVLKGAQGGLYGRNATGGVVNIITRQPSTDDYVGKGKISYGEKNTFTASAYQNIPLSDKVAWSISLERDSHDPYVKNIAKPNPYTAAMFPSGAFGMTPAQTAAFFNSGVHVQKGEDSQDFWATDTKLLVQPTEDFKITFAADYSRKHDTGGNQIVNATEDWLNGVIPGLFGSVGIATNFPTDYFKASNGAFTTARGTTAYTWLTDFGGSATAVWSLPGVDLTSISAYRGQASEFSDDFAASPVPTVHGVVNLDKWFFYQEVRAVSSGDGPFHYLAGATYLINHYRATNTVTLLDPFFQEPASHMTDKADNWSVYAQLGYDITDDLNLTGSLRYVQEKNSGYFDKPVPEAGGASFKETAVLPSATLSYKLDGGTLYARWAKGFKAGGINPTAPASLFAPYGYVGSVFGPERVSTYEVGYRAPLFGDTVQLTTAAFYNDYKNLQSAAHSTDPTILIAMVNAGSARTYGAEEELNWRVNDAVTLGANVGYLDAKFLSFAIPPGTGTLEPFNASHQTMPNSPKWQLSFTGSLDQPISDDFRLVGDVLVSHLSSIVFLQSAIPGVLPVPSQSGYWLTNLRIGVRTTDDRYGLSVYANNLFNQAYYAYGSSSSLGNDMNWGDPRIVGVEFTANW